MKMKQMTLLLVILVLLTGCSPKITDKQSSKKTDKSTQVSISDSQKKANSKQDTVIQSTSTTSTSVPESAKPSEETTTSTPSVVIGEKQPLISETVSGLPSTYLGNWKNPKSGDYFEISQTQLVSGSSVNATTSDISKVGKDREGYLVQTVDGRSYYFTLRDKKLYPTTSQEDLSSEIANQLMFEKTSK